MEEGLELQLDDNFELRLQVWKAKDRYRGGNMNGQIRGMARFDLKCYET